MAAAARRAVARVAEQKAEATGLGGAAARAAAEAGAQAAVEAATGRGLGVAEARTVAVAERISAQVRDSYPRAHADSSDQRSPSAALHPRGVPRDCGVWLDARDDGADGQGRGRPR